MLTDQVKKTYVSKKHRISLHRFGEIFLSELNKNAIPERASGMAFSFMLSMFPGIIFVFTLLPYIPIPDLEGHIMFSLKNLLPVSVYNGVAAAIYDILHIQHSGLLSFGFLFAIFSATNGIMAMITAFNRCYRSGETRNYFKKLGTAISIVFLLLTIVVISIFVAILTHHYLTKLHLNHHFLYYFAVVFKYVFFFGVFYFAISSIYYLAPAVAVRWRFFSAGSFIASLLIVVFTLGFSFYLNSFDSYNKLYGSIGALIGLMLWIYGISIMILVGFEINASLDMGKREMAKERH